MCIIEKMAQENRENTMTLRLTDEEVDLRDQLARQHGINGSGVMRMALRRLAKLEGVEPKQAASDQKPGRRSRDE